MRGFARKREALTDHDVAWGLFQVLPRSVFKRLIKHPSLGLPRAEVGTSSRSLALQRTKVSGVDSQPCAGEHDRANDEGV
jgi:hypothetical protein